MRTCAVFFPFDLFGSGGTAAGAEALADAVREMLADNKREKMPTRARAYQDKLKLREFVFETPGDYQDWRRQGRRAARRALAGKERLLWVAGNHLGVLPVYDELSKLHPDCLVIQFDAHLDIYNLTDCTTELSHGNFLMNCVGPLPPVINVGHRELLLPGEHVRRYYKDAIAADQLARNPDTVITHLRQLAQAAPAIFLDLDCDVFDPAYFPGLTHPQPFGLSPLLLLRLLDAVWSERTLGLALSEYSSAHDQNDRSLATLLWLVEYLLLRWHETPT